MSNTNITAGRFANALLESIKARAVAAEQTADHLYTPAQLDIAYKAMNEGTHQSYPAAGYWLEVADRAWAEYSRLFTLAGRINRDRRIGQLTFEFWG